MKRYYSIHFGHSTYGIDIQDLGVDPAQVEACDISDAVTELLGEMYPTLLGDDDLRWGLAGDITLMITKNYAPPPEPPTEENN